MTKMAALVKAFVCVYEALSRLLFFLWHGVIWSRVASLLAPDNFLERRRQMFVSLGYAASDTDVTFDGWNSAYGSSKSTAMAFNNFWESLSFCTSWVDTGDRVPNLRLTRLQVNEAGMQTTLDCRLLDFASAGRPLVLNFGSCT